MIWIKTYSFETFRNNWLLYNNYITITIRGTLFFQVNSVSNNFITFSCCLCFYLPIFVSSNCIHISTRNFISSKLKTQFLKTQSILNQTRNLGLTFSKKFFDTMVSRSFVSPHEFITFLYLECELLTTSKPLI